MALVSNAPAPVSDPIAQRRRQGYGAGQDPFEGLPTKAWIEWFNQLGTVVEASPTKVTVVSLSLQAASIGATDFSGGALSAGLYQVSYYARITQAATTNSSLTVTFDWTDTAVNPSYSGTAITGNTTTTVQSGTIMIYSDRNAPVRYSTTYSSTGATPMQYALKLVLQKVPE